MDEVRGVCAISTVLYGVGVVQVPKVLTEALDNAGMTVQDVDWLLLHQVKHPTARVFVVCRFSWGWSKPV